ncbi:MAG: ABC transporter permease, partial [Armatimonadota bacterium]
MNLLEALRMALIGLRANKMRAGLTMLGIIIGVGSVIAMIAIGRGASADIEERIRALGTNLLIVWPGQARRGRLWGGVGSVDSLKLEDGDAIRRKCQGVVQVAPHVTGGTQVKWRNQNTNTSIIGTTPSYTTVNNHPIEVGRIFTEREVRGARRVCVVGTTLVENLFGRNDPLGQRIRIKNIPFEVIGVLRTKGGATSWRDPDDVIVVPISVAMRRLFGQDYVNRIYVVAQRSDSLWETADEI